MSNTMIDALEAGAKWSTLIPSEQIIARAIARRLFAMAEAGATPEDWHQLAGYAEWAAKPGARPSPRIALTLAGQWADWLGGPCPCEVGARVDVQHRNGRVTNGLRAGALFWSHTDPDYDIVAYRIAD